MGLAGPQATARARARMLWAESRGGLSQARGSGEVSIFLHRSHLLLLLQLRARCASLLAWHLPVFLLPAPYSSHPFPSLQRFVRTCVRAPTQPPSSPLLRISSSPSFPSLLACSLHLLGHSCTLFPPRTRRTLRLTAFACFPSVLTSVLMRPSSLPASLPLSHAHLLCFPRIPHPSPSLLCALVLTCVLATSLTPLRVFFNTKLRYPCLAWDGTSLLWMPHEEASAEMACTHFVKVYCLCFVNLLRSNRSPSTRGRVEVPLTQDALPTRRE